jgi:hypothetical protein
VTTVPVQTTSAPVSSAPVVPTATTTTSTTTSTTIEPETTSTSSTTSTTEVPESTPEETQEVEQEQKVEEIVTDLDNIEDLSNEEVTELIESIAELELTDEQAEAIAEVLSSAPPEVKEEFEATVNVFSGQFDNYIPNNSVVSVGTRRSLIAAVGSVTAIAATPRRKL